MSAANSPLKRPSGRCLIVGNPSARAQPLSAMQSLGYECAEIDDPYAAAAELFRRPMVYRTLVLSLTSLFREELPLVGTIKRRLPHVDIWLTHIDGRQAALVEAMRLGAHGLLGDDGLLHRVSGDESQEATDSAEPVATEPAGVPPIEIPEPRDVDYPDTEPVLSADELRALLQEQPLIPPDDAG